MKRTIIFDMDGVIIDTEPIHHKAFFATFAELGLPITPAEYADFLGASTRNVFETLKSRYHLPQSVADLMRRKRELFNEVFDTDPTLDLLPGVRPLLDDIRQAGLGLVLASSASHNTIKRVFNRFGLGPYFAHAVSGEDFTRSKPDPAIFLHAAALARTPVAECVVIEDSHNGIVAAKAAGIYCIAYASPHSEGQDTALADLVIQDFAELSAARLAALA